MKRKNLKYIIDAAMLILLPLLMAYSLIGETIHEVAGSLMFVLFITHHIRNRGWYKVLFRQLHLWSVFQMILNFALLMIMLAQPISGILMSKHLYTFLPTVGTAAAREIHLCLAYWGFVLMSVHLGTHLVAPLRRLWQSKRVGCVVVHLLWLAVSVYGCVAFIKRDLADYMFHRSMFAFFDFSEPRVFFFLDYIAMILLFALVGYGITVGLIKADVFRSTK